MAITKLTNTQIQNIANLAYKEFTGQEGVDVVLDLSTFTDDGVKDIGALRSKYTGKLLGVLTKNWFTDSSYRSTYKDVFFEDSARFGAIVQSISVSVPEVKENSAWKDFVSGTSTIGQYTVYLPVVDTKYYAKSESWALPITVTGEQWDTAFKNEQELSNFVEYLFMVVDNAIVQHMEDMNALNRNNFIAEKINAQSTVGLYQSYNLTEEYATEKGLTTSKTVAEFLNDKEFLKWASAKIKLFMGYLQKQTILFNTDGKVRFTPKDRLVVQLLGDFVTRYDSIASSDTFHNDMIALPLYEEIASWQSMEDLSFDGVSSINVKTAQGDTIEKGGIIGLVCDKWAILHTIRSNRVGSQYFGIEDMTHYEYQFRDSYMNDLSMNGIVFYVDDFTAE